MPPVLRSSKPEVDRLVTNILMEGITSSEQPSALLRDENFGKSKVPLQIVLGRMLTAVGITNAQRIDLLQVVSGLQNMSNLYIRMYDPD